jgi:hypothetical protein
MQSDIKTNAPTHGKYPACGLILLTFGERIALLSFPKTEIGSTDSTAAKTLVIKSQRYDFTVFNALMQNENSL